MYRISVDIGGSFTDFAVLDEDSGELRTLKVFSRPDSIGAEILEGMRILEQRDGIDPATVCYFTHGTTVGVNAVIERKGLALGLLTTRNFEDVLELARLKTADMYNLLARRPEPLIPRRRVFGVDERMAPDGSIRHALDEADVEYAVRAALRSGCEGLVIAFLHAYRNPVHEHLAKTIAARVAPGLPVVCSSDVWPIIREYERTITAVIAGYVQPTMAQYFSSLQSALHSVGVPAELRVTKSNGGVMTAEAAKERCIEMVLSGTASGVIGASHIAGLCGLNDCLSLDIGGTSADMALIVDGGPQFGTGEFIGDFRIFVPSVAVSSIGDGGGSVAWVDSHGVLKVGPDSAGSSPGPVCYGQGGTRPTVTDAFAANGWLGSDTLGYDAVTVDRAASVEAIGGLAAKIGGTVQEAAGAVIDIAVSSMYSGISGTIARYGMDPQRLAMLAFGGAGPMMANFLAREIGINLLVVPPAPGVLSAFGGLVADLKNDFVRTVYRPLDGDAADELAATVAELRAEGETWLREEQGYKGTTTIQVFAELRYVGQSFEIEVPLEERWFQSRNTSAIADSFHVMHRKVYGHADVDAEVQIVAVRVVATGVTPKPRLQPMPSTSEPALVERHADVWLDGGWRKVPLYRRGALRSGQAFAGPAIVIQPDCTTCVLPGYGVQVDAYVNMHIQQLA